MSETKYPSHVCSEHDRRIEELKSEIEAYKGTCGDLWTKVAELERALSAKEGKCEQ